MPDRFIGSPAEDLEQKMQAPRRTGTIKRAKTKRLDADLKQTADCRSLVQRLWTLEDEFPQELREACLAAGDTHSNRVLNRV